jgi:hypothetical protein
MPYSTRPFCPVARARTIQPIPGELAARTRRGFGAGCCKRTIADLDVPTVTAAWPLTWFRDQMLGPLVLYRTRAKSSHQCRRRSAATRPS